MKWPDWCFASSARRLVAACAVCCRLLVLHVTGSGHRERVWSQGAPAPCDQGVKNVGIPRFSSSGHRERPAPCDRPRSTPVGRNVIRACFCVASHGTVGCNAILACFCTASHGFTCITACIQGIFRQNRWKMAVCKWRLRSVSAVGRHASGTQRDSGAVLHCIPRISGTQCNSGLFTHCVPRNSGMEHTIATYAHCIPQRRPHRSLHSGDIQAKSLENGGLQMASSYAPAVGRHASGTQRDSSAVLHCVPRITTNQWDAV